MDNLTTFTIIWYSILGCFPVILIALIVMHAVRVFRHPERFGLQTAAGQPVQRRIGGIGRALLDSLPVVKYGRQGPNSSENPDVELQSIPAGHLNGGPHPTNPGLANENKGNCSICTEDFFPQDDVRVLPCEHGFHPGCVDPWLFRSGTCPLCRHEILPAAPPLAHLSPPVLRVVNV